MVKIKKDKMENKQMKKKIIKYKLILMEKKNNNKMIKIPKIKLKIRKKIRNQRNH